MGRSSVVVWKIPKRRNALLMDFKINESQEQRKQLQLMTENTKQESVASK